MAFFFSRLDFLIGSSFKISPAAALTPTPIRRLPPHPSSVPVGPGDSFFRRNFSKIAAAAAAVEAEEDYLSDVSRRSGSNAARQRNVPAGCRQLVDAIVRFGEIYERVEEAKQKQMIELEKQRMEFAKDLDIQRMKIFMESSSN